MSNCVVYYVQIIAFTDWSDRMPAGYAHYVFGQKVLKELPRDLQEQIKDYLPLYHIGIHGPDILFYYEPFKANDINKMGHTMHDEPADDFFERAQLRILASRGEEKLAMQAYIAGFIAHYMLDSECHGYVNKKMEESELSHVEIETEFDCMLMRKKGLDPRSRNAVKHIAINDKSAAIIAQFFGLEAKQILKAVKDMKRYQELFMAPNKAKRLMICTALKVSKKYDNLHGLIVNEEPNPKCVDSNWELLHLMKDAVEPCAELVEEYLEGCSDRRTMNERFSRKFS